MIEDQDPIETREWLEALDSVLKNGGSETGMDSIIMVQNRFNELSEQLLGNP